MEVDEPAIGPGEVGDPAVEAAMAGPPLPGVDAEGAQGVVAEGGVIDVADQDGADREGPEEGVEVDGEVVDPRAGVRQEAHEEVVAADRQERGRGPLDLQATCLHREVDDRRAVDGPVFESGRTPARQVAAQELGEEGVVVYEEELAGVQAVVVVVGAVEDRVAEGVEREHDSAQPFGGGPIDHPRHSARHGPEQGGRHWAATSPRRAQATASALRGPKARTRIDRAARMGAIPMVRAWRGTFGSPPKSLAASARVV